MPAIYIPRRRGSNADVTVGCECNAIFIPRLRGSVPLSWWSCRRYGRSPMLASDVDVTVAAADVTVGLQLRVDQSLCLLIDPVDRSICSIHLVDPVHVLTSTCPHRTIFFDACPHVVASLLRRTTLCQSFAGLFAHLHDGTLCHHPLMVFTSSFLED